MKKRLIDLFPEPLVNGIFFEMSQNSTLSEIFHSIGIDDESDYHSIDFEYIINNSGLKPLSMVGEQYYQYNSTENATNYITAVINIIDTRFSKKWSDLIATVYADYNILTPYEMTVSEEGNELETENTTGARNSSGTSTNTSNTSQSNTKQVTGYNNNEFVDSDKNVGTIGSSNTSTDKAETSNNEDRHKTNINSRSIKRSGNIGNHSAAELLEQQRSLVRFEILQVIFDDLDSLLVRSLY